MNKRNSFVALFALFILIPIQAQLLWKVSGNGLTKPSYLFGTHHLIEKNQIKDFDKILNLAGQADAVVGEMDMSNMLSLQLKMLNGVMMKDTLLKDLMSQADYTLVDTEFKLLMNVGLDKLGNMKPMMLSSMYTIMTYTKQANLTKQPEAVDLLFQKRAQEENKQVIGLETIEQQLNILFNSIPLKRQAEILVQEVKEKDKGIEQLKKLNEAYLSGDLKTLEDLNNEDHDMTAREKKIIIDDRTSGWVKQLSALIPVKSCFVAVGCMHLVGPAGLIDLLKKAGYTVEGVDVF